MNNVTPLHRGIIRPATNDQGMILGEPDEDAALEAEKLDEDEDEAEAREWSLLFFAGLVGFALGLLSVAVPAIVLAGWVL